MLLSDKLRKSDKNYTVSSEIKTLKNLRYRFRREQNYILIKNLDLVLSGL